MTSSHFNGPLKKIKPLPKAVTPRQVAFLAQKKKDQLQTSKSQSIFEKYKKKGLSDQSGTTSSNTSSGPQPDDAGNFNDTEEFEDDIIERFDPSLATDLEDNMNEDGWEDVLDSDDEDIISGLQRARYDERRLNQEFRWTHQITRMIPSFLRCRQLTSNWGNWKRWDEDFRQPCSCPAQRQRTVWIDMVDFLSELSLFHQSTLILKKLMCT